MYLSDFILFLKDNNIEPDVTNSVHGSMTSRYNDHDYFKMNSTRKYNIIVELCNSREIDDDIQRNFFAFASHKKMVEYWNKHTNKFFTDNTISNEVRTNFGFKNTIYYYLQNLLHNNHSYSILDLENQILLKKRYSIDIHTKNYEEYKRIEEYNDEVIEDFSNSEDDGFLVTMCIENNKLNSYTAIDTFLNILGLHEYNKDAYNTLNHSLVLYSYIDPNRTYSCEIFSDYKKVYSFIAYIPKHKINDFKRLKIFGSDYFKLTNLTSSKFYRNHTFMDIYNEYKSIAEQIEIDSMYNTIDDSFVYKCILYDNDVQ